MCIVCNYVFILTVVFLKKTPLLLAEAKGVFFKNTTVKLRNIQLLLKWPPQARLFITTEALGDMSSRKCKLRFCSF